MSTIASPKAKAKSNSKTKGPRLLGRLALADLGLGTFGRQIASADGWGLHVGPNRANLQGPAGGLSLSCSCAAVELYDVPADVGGSWLEVRLVDGADLIGVRVYRHRQDFAGWWVAAETSGSQKGGRYFHVQSAIPTSIGNALLALFGKDVPAGLIQGDPREQQRAGSMADAGLGMLSVVRGLGDLLRRGGNLGLVDRKALRALAGHIEAIDGLLVPTINGKAKAREGAGHA